MSLYLKRYILFTLGIAGFFGGVFSLVAFPPIGIASLIACVCLLTRAETIRKQIEGEDD